ncbi:MAG: hypothetical protein HY938_05210 [Nitrosomonadales bacterium]|nr:hypothetical protein [Nitrosomonadales bacterium]
MTGEPLYAHYVDGQLNQKWILPRDARAQRMNLTPPLLLPDNPSMNSLHTLKHIRANARVNLRAVWLRAHGSRKVWSGELAI